MAALYDRFMQATEDACLRHWRAELLSGLHGKVLEVGAGTGANLAHYPPQVTEIVLTEPDAAMSEKLATRLAGTENELHGARVGHRPGARISGVSGRAISFVAADVSRLPFADETFDAVVATLLLCSVPDPVKAVAEMKRVLVPGGTFVFLEHVGAEARSTRRTWQGRIEPLWKHVAGNCHLTRDTARTLEEAGFESIELRRESMRKALPFLRPTVRGLARKSG
jgi:ubiquinone/menaquinone biosynthesis C-methylase UbiE